MHPLCETCQPTFFPDYLFPLFRLLRDQLLEQRYKDMTLYHHDLELMGIKLMRETRQISFLFIYSSQHFLR